MNDPLLYIDSVKTTDNNKSSNQEYFDSRNKPNLNKALHRFDDIKAMLSYNMKVLVEIKAKDSIYEGYVLDITDKELKLKINANDLVIPLVNIVYVNILKI